jgi:hypothetical protein
VIILKKLKEKKKNLMINEIDNKEMRELVCLWYELVVIMIWRILGDGETIIIKEWGRSVYHSCWKVKQRDWMIVFGLERCGKDGFLYYNN